MNEEATIEFSVDLPTAGLAATQERVVTPLVDSAAADRIRSPDLAAEADEWANLQVIPLHNPCDPRWTLKREKLEHRVIVYLKAQGHTYGEIAQRTGFCKTTIANVCKQPWARSIILAEITKAGRDQVETVLQGEALESVLKLIDIRDNEKAPIETQRKASNDILDRVYGKPNQPVSHADIDAKALTDKQLMEIARRGMTTNSAATPSN